MFLSYKKKVYNDKEISCTCSYFNVQAIAFLTGDAECKLCLLVQ